MDVALVTYSKLPALHPQDRPLLGALADAGLSSTVVSWDDPTFDWAAPRLCVLRSPWDYTERRDDFLSWADSLEPSGKLCNPASVLRWNAHKGYLRDLEAKGVPVVPTAFCARGQAPALGPLLEAQGWAEALIKPAVSSGARGVHRVSASTLADSEARLHQALEHGDMMVQPFLPGLDAAGERSLVFFDGVYSHAFHRPAMRANPFTVPTATLIEPTAEELRLAEQTLAASPAPLLLARVDLVRDAAGTSRVLELELIDPVLFFELDPSLAPRLVAAISGRLRRAPALRLIELDDPLYAEELELRFRVLREPLGHARADVPFPFEAQSLHLVAIERGKVVGCVLFHPEGGGVGRLFQMAVEPSLQKRGLGGQLVRRLEAELRGRGIREVTLHAREAVVPFYEKLGYACRGERFVEVGLPHRHMARRLEARA